MAKTTDKTVAAFIESLIDDHTENCDPEIPQVLGRVDGSEANVESTTIRPNLTYPTLHLELSDGTKFAIRVQQLK